MAERSDAELQWETFQHTLAEKAVEYFAKEGTDSLITFLAWLDVRSADVYREYRDSISESTVPYWYESGS